VAIVLIGAVALLSIEAIFFNIAIGKTVFFSIAAKETEVIHAVNQLEAVKIGLPYALEYSFYQAVYDVSKSGGYYSIPADTPTYNSLPVWRKYDKTYEPGYLDEIRRSTLANLNKYISSVDFINSVSYTEISIGEYIPIVRKSFVCCSPCKCTSCYFYGPQKVWRKCFCSSDCENAGAVCLCDQPGCSEEACKPKNSFWRLGSCTSGESNYALTYCTQASTTEEACRNRCNEIGMSYLQSTSLTCTCEYLQPMPNTFAINASSPQEISITSPLYNASIESNVLQVVKTNIFNILAAAESKFVGSDAIKDKITTSLNSYNCSSDNETVKSVVTSAVSSIQISNENISLSVSPAEVRIKPECNSTAAVVVEVKLTDKLNYPVYDGTTAYRNPQLRFYVITSNDYSFQPI
jgi:hypothetical protein